MVNGIVVQYMQYVIICIALFRAAIRIITYCNTYRKTYRKWPLFGVDSPPLGVDSPPFGVANGDLAFFGVRLARFGVANAALPDSAISSLLGVANSQLAMLRFFLSPFVAFFYALEVPTFVSAMAFFTELNCFVCFSHPTACFHTLPPHFRVGNDIHDPQIAKFPRAVRH